MLCAVIISSLSPDRRRSTGRDFLGNLIIWKPNRIGTAAPVALPSGGSRQRQPDGCGRPAEADHARDPQPVAGAGGSGGLPLGPEGRPRCLSPDPCGHGASAGRIAGRHRPCCAGCDISALQQGCVGNVVLDVVSPGKYFAPGLIACLLRLLPQIEATLRIGNRDTQL